MKTYNYSCKHGLGITQGQVYKDGLWPLSVFCCTSHSWYYFVNLSVTLIVFDSQSKNILVLLKVGCETEDCKVWLSQPTFLTVRQYPQSSNNNTMASHMHKHTHTDLYESDKTLTLHSDCSIMTGIKVCYTREGTDVCTLLILKLCENHKI